MKLAKAMKKLKFWSRKRHRKKNHVLIEHPPPPPPPPCHCRHSTAEFQPSAPPWLHPDHTQNSLSESPFGPYLGIASSSHAEFIPQEIASEFNSLQFPAPPVSNTSYQQYMVPNPVYGVPVMPAVRRERAARAVCFIINFGRHLFRCFCPCFHIREVNRNWI